MLRRVFGWRRRATVRQAAAGGYESDDQHLTVTAHLEELRYRLIVTVISVGITTVLAFILGRDIIFDLLIRPEVRGHLQAIELTENFGTQMRVSLVTGVALAMPVLAYQILRFVSPGLTSRERRFLFASLPAIVVMFAGGVLFGYFFVLPPALKFLISFGSEFAQPAIRIGNYISFVTNLLLVVGVAFETPIFIFALAQLGVVNARQLARYRRHAIVLAFIASAILTPTVDPVTQTIVAVPIIILYEAGIILARFAKRG